MQSVRGRGIYDLWQQSEDGGQVQSRGCCWDLGGSGRIKGALWIHGGVGGDLERTRDNF